MRVHVFEWDEGNREHIHEHHVDEEEAEETFEEKHYLYRTRDGRYSLLGRSGIGRYLFVVFEYEGRETARVVTARDMTITEKRLYHRKVQK